MVRRHARWAGTVALLVVVAIVAALTSDGLDVPRSDRRTPVTPAEDPCRSPLPERAVGVAPGSDWKSDRRAGGDLREMADMGVHWIRLSFEWSVIEARRGVYRWDSVDRIMEEAGSTCMAVLAMVGTTPEWARGDGCSNLWCPPDDPADFARFVTAVAERYAGEASAIRAWEIWNEENHAAWFRPVVDADRFGRLAVAATRAIRQQEPDATVLLGGLAPSLGGNPKRVLPDQFLEEVYDTGAMDDLDGVAYHPYSYPNLPSTRTGTNGFIDQIEAVRKVMVDHGDGDERIWLTEFGFPTPGGDMFALTRQEEMVSDGFATWRSLDYAGPLFWFSWRDRQPGTGDLQPEFGLRFADDRPKPAFGVFAQELQR